MGGRDKVNHFPPPIFRQIKIVSHYLPSQLLDSQPQVSLLLNCCNNVMYKM